MIKENNFDKVERYKLYRNVKEIVHPTISKKNISRYIIVLKEELYPVRIFYPEKVANIDKILFFIHGKKEVTKMKYAACCTEIALKTGSLAICIDYEETEEKEQISKCYKTIKYILDELETLKIENLKITLSGDSTGANIVLSINEMLKENINEFKTLLFYPILSKLKDYKNKVFNNTLIIIGSADPEKKEVVNYEKLLKEKKYNHQILELNFLSHALLKQIDKEDKEEMYLEINKFINM